MGTLAQVAVAAAAFVVVAGLAWVSPKTVRSLSPLVVALAAVAGVVGGLAADGQATGIGGYDAVLRALAGVGFVAAGCYATARPRLAASAILAAASLLGSGDAWPAVVALGASLALVVLRIDGAAAGALVGLALGQAALRLDWPDATGATLVVGVAAFSVLGISALAHVHRRTRRRVGVVAAVVGALVLLIAGVWGVTALSVRKDLSHAVDVANAGLDAARAGDTATAASLFDEARVLFDDAGERLDAPWAQPIRVLPVAAQNARALRVMTDAGRELSRAGADTARSADPDQITPVDGAVPLDEVRALAAPLADAAIALADARRDLADIDSPWLVRMLASKLETLDDKVTRGARDAETARLAVEVVPGLLGGDGERRYFVAFQTPAEQRANGGIIGNFAEIAYDAGDVELLRSARDGDYNEGNPGAPRTLVGPEEYIRRYAIYNPHYLLQSVTVSPDFPSVAEVLEGVYPQTGGSEVDGVISFDPVALAEFLRLTGNVTVPGYGIELTPDNAADLLLREQYVRFTDNDTRVDFLDATVRAVFARLESTELPGPSRIGEVLGPMVREGRLQIHSRRPEEQAFFQRIGADGAFPASDGGDFLGVVTQNGGGNKIDVYQQRDVRYDAVVDPATGAVDATATVTVRNDSPASGLPDYVIGSFPDNPLPIGTNRVVLSVYSPHELASAAIDGTEVPVALDHEAGRNVYTAQLDIPAGDERRLTLRLRGGVDLQADGERYRLRMWHQATVNPDRVRVTVSAASGWAVEAGRNLRVTPSGDATARTRARAEVFVARFRET